MIDIFNEYVIFKIYSNYCFCMLYSLMFLIAIIIHLYLHKKIADALYIYLVLSTYYLVNIVFDYFKY